MSNNEFPPIPGEEENFPKDKRDARLRWDIGRTRQDPQLNFGEMPPAVKAEFDGLVAEANTLWEKLNIERRTGMLVMKDDVDMVLQKIHSALAISNDEAVAELREKFLKEYPDAGMRT